MPRRSLILLLALSAPLPALGIAAGCGHTVVVDDNPGSGGSGGAGGDTPSSSSGVGGKDGGKDALEEYTDPGCDSGPAPTDFQCDPYNQFNGDCAPGEGCFIWVQYPEPGEVCGQEIYGSVCAPAGFGGQGDTCFGGTDCQAGFVCVVTGAGNQCVQLCPLVGNDNCPPGLVCESVDVEGFGGCL